MTSGLIKPHGGELIDRTGPRPDGVESLELLEHADRSLGLAKKSGRRRAVASSRPNTH